MKLCVLQLPTKGKPRHQPANLMIVRHARASVGDPVHRRSVQNPGGMPHLHRTFPCPSRIKKARLRYLFLFSTLTYWRVYSETSDSGTPRIEGPSASPGKKKVSSADRSVHDDSESDQDTSNSKLGDDLSGSSIDQTIGDSQSHRDDEGKLPWYTTYRFLFSFLSIQT